MAAEPGAAKNTPTFWLGWEWSRVVVGRLKETGFWPGARSWEEVETLIWLTGSK